MSPHHRTLAALVGVLLCAGLATAALDDGSTVSPNSSNNNNNNYDCPADCQCVLVHTSHKPHLHAKCSSIADLRSETPLNAKLPIHSVDLSYLGLARLSHSLEKLRDLTSVDLSHNELHEIGHLGRRIKKLNLKHNRLTSAKLGKLPQHVQILNLQHNDITYLPLEFTKLSQLQSLELSHNQINCSCETLEVRNWLQEKHVFMEHPVKCFYPAEVRNKSWLQVKQAEICEKEKRGWVAAAAATDAEAEENELMLGDQPVEGSGGHGEDEEEEELGKAFIPIDSKPTKSSENLQYNDVEGSGDLSDLNLPLDVEPPLMMMARAHGEEATTEMPTQAEDEDEDGSGSGGGILFIPHLPIGAEEPDDFDAPDATTTDNAGAAIDDDDFDNRPVPEPTEEATPSPDIFGNGMGIFDGEEEPQPVTEGPIVPVVFHETQAGADDSITDGPDATDDDADGEDEDEAGPDVKTADLSGNKDDSNATYYLLGVIGLIVIGLIFFVAIKRCSRNGRGSHDPENPRATELLDMDKKNPGKPVQRNGNGTEHAPLIGEKSKADMAKPINGAGAKKPYEAGDLKDGPAQQQPLLNGGNATNGTGNATAPTDPAESNNNEAVEVPKVDEPPAPHEYYPITPRYPPPKSPRASKYAQYPQGEHNNNNNESFPDDNDNVFTPSSPKGGRYSPVYSPETGRVKIKLTETPRPKTPMLVTRSKSNAGDIITTPVRAAGHLETPAVHVGGPANGRVEQH